LRNNLAKDTKKSVQENLICSNTAHGSLVTIQATIHDSFTKFRNFIIWPGPTGSLH